MGMIVVGLARDAHTARSLARALEDGGFRVEKTEPAELVLLGVPRDGAHARR